MEPNVSFEGSHANNPFNEYKSNFLVYVHREFTPHMHVRNQSALSNSV
jgi:hypothetical protein